MKAGAAAPLATRVTDGGCNVLLLGNLPPSTQPVLGLAATDYHLLKLNTLRSVSPAMANSERAPVRSPSNPSFPHSSSRQAIHAPQVNQPQVNSRKSRPDDYVYFDRSTSSFSSDAAPRAKTAQLKLEHFYKVAVESAVERNTRCLSRPLIRSPCIDTTLGSQTRGTRTATTNRRHDA